MTVADLAPLPVGFPQKLQGLPDNSEVPLDNMVYFTRTPHTADRTTTRLLTLLPTSSSAALLYQQHRLLTDGCWLIVNQSAAEARLETAGTRTLQSDAIFIDNSYLLSHLLDTGCAVVASKTDRIGFFTALTPPGFNSDILYKITIKLSKHIMSSFKCLRGDYFNALHPLSAIHSTTTELPATFPPVGNYPPDVLVTFPLNQLCPSVTGHWPARAHYQQTTKWPNHRVYTN